MDYRKFFNFSLKATLALSPIGVSIVWIFFWNVGRIFHFDEINKGMIIFICFSFCFFYALLFIFVGFYLDVIYNWARKKMSFFILFFLFFYLIFLSMLAWLYSNDMWVIMFFISVILISAGFLISLVISFFSISIGYKIRSLFLKNKK